MTIYKNIEKKISNTGYEKLSDREFINLLIYKIKLYYMLISNTKFISQKHYIIFPHSYFQRYREIILSAHLNHKKAYISRNMIQKETLINNKHYENTEYILSADNILQINETLYRAVLKLEWCRRVFKYEMYPDIIEYLDENYLKKLNENKKDLYLVHKFNKQLFIIQKKFKYYTGRYQKQFLSKIKNMRKLIKKYHYIICAYLNFDDAFFFHLRDVLIPLTVEIQSCLDDLFKYNSNKKINYIDVYNTYLHLLGEINGKIEQPIVCEIKDRKNNKLDQKNIYVEKENNIQSKYKINLSNFKNCFFDISVNMNYSLNEIMRAIKQEIENMIEINIDYKIYKVSQNNLVDEKSVAKRLFSDKTVKGGVFTEDDIMKFKQSNMLFVFDYLIETIYENVSSAEDAFAIFSPKDEIELNKAIENYRKTIVKYISRLFSLKGIYSLQTYINNLNA